MCTPFFFDERSVIDIGALAKHCIVALSPSDDRGPFHGFLGLCQSRGIPIRRSLPDECDGQVTVMVYNVELPATKLNVRTITFSLFVEMVDTVEAQALVAKKYGFAIPVIDIPLTTAAFIGRCNVRWSGAAREYDALRLLMADNRAEREHSWKVHCGIIPVRAVETAPIPPSPSPSAASINGSDYSCGQERDLAVSAETTPTKHSCGQPLSAPGSAQPTPRAARQSAPLDPATITPPHLVKGEVNWALPETPLVASARANGPFTPSWRARLAPVDLSRGFNIGDLPEMSLHQFRDQMLHSWLRARARPDKGDQAFNPLATPSPLVMEDDGIDSLP